MLPTLIVPLITGVSEDNEIRILSLLSLHKAMEVFQAATAPLLPQFIDPFKTILRTKPREQAVKQELERLDESQRGVIKVGLEVQKRYPEGVGQTWSEWWANVRTEQTYLLKQVEEESREGR
jgi:cullin-associated NEDD8-dissociated protein 1